MSAKSGARPARSAKSPPNRAIHPHQLYTWRDQAAAALPELFADQAATTLAAHATAPAIEVAQRYAEIGRLTTDFTWLKKSVRAKKVAALPRADQVSLLDRPPQELALVRQAALLGLHRAQLYDQPLPIPSATCACWN